MNKHFSKRIACALALVAACVSGPTHAQDLSSSNNRPLSLVVRRAPPDARLPVRLEAMHIEAEIVGTIARTRIELEFFNPNERVLEGELQFPLLDGQTVSGFALDIDGVLRNAVPVPKEKGRQVFDDVTRQRIDPALLQLTQGNNYSLRVYPIPARGTRRVALEITQALVQERGAEGALVYRLPTSFSGRIARLDGRIRLAGVADAPGVVATLSSQRQIETGSDGAGSTVVRFQATGVENPGLLEVRRPALSGIHASTEDYRGKTYFYAEVPADARLPAAARPLPQRLGIVWDASMSAQRDTAKDLALLQAYFERVRNTTVLLRMVRNVAEPTQEFVVRDGDWRSLKARLQQVVYDGATSAALLDATPDGADLALVFTDGLLNFGEPGAQRPARVPTMTISSAVAADTGALRRIAESSGGEFVDLATTAVPAALRQLTLRRVRIAGIDGQGAGEFVMSSPYAADGRYRIAGVMHAAKAELRLTLVDGNGNTHQRSIPITAGPNGAPGARLAAQQWATMQLAALQADEATNLRSIERLGMHFRIPTSRTSLIVLDRAEDYARYEIEPPAEDVSLREAVERLLAQGQERAERAKQAQLAKVFRDFDERKAWWNRDFPKDARRPALDKSVNEAALASPPAPAPAMRPRGVESERRAMAAAAPSPGVQREAKSEGPTGPADSSIQLKKWSPDSAYARRMRAAQGEDAYRVYLDERANHLNSTAFFLDAADILIEKKQPALAARVASNLAEMNLENRHILRILAYRLMQMNEHGLAIPALARVLALAPDEPQSWRDLALAQASMGRHQQAIENLWHVVSNPWHGRFPGIEMTALSELNAIVAKAKAAGETLDTRAVPDRLLQNMPVGLRVTLAWDADNTDIDLWVIDPNGEQSFYGNRLSRQGGAMSPDFTGGYGPEEFSLKQPKPGKYLVKANFYGHNQQIVAPSTTLMMSLFTHFGTPQQKVEQVILRLSGRNEVIEVGEFTVGAPAQ